MSAARTPTLFLIGENDPRVPLSQSIEIMPRAQSAGRPERAPHRARMKDTIWVSPAHQLYKMNAEIEWFEKYVRHVPYIPETAPSKNDAAMVPAP